MDSKTSLNKGGMVTAGEEERLSLNDLRLKRYLDLKAQAKDLERQLEELRTELLHQGSFSSLHFLCIVKEEVRVIAPSTAELIRLFGEGVKKHLKSITMKKVIVQEKQK